MLRYASLRHAKYQTLPDMSRLILLIALLTVQFGCASSDAVRMDTGSEAAFEASLNEMQRTLNQAEKQKLMIALLQIRMMELGSAREAQESVSGGQVINANKMSAINGLTYQEILLLAEQSDVNAEILR